MMIPVASFAAIIDLSKTSALTSELQIAAKSLPPNLISLTTISADTRGAPIINSYKSWQIALLMDGGTLTTYYDTKISADTRGAPFTGRFLESQIALTMADTLSEKTNSYFTTDAKTKQLTGMSAEYEAREMKGAVARGCIMLNSVEISDYAQLVLKITPSYGQISEQYIPVINERTSKTIEIGTPAIAQHKTTMATNTGSMKYGMTHSRLSAGTVDSMKSAIMFGAKIAA